MSHTVLSIVIYFFVTGLFNAALMHSIPETAGWVRRGDRTGTTVTRFVMWFLAGGAVLPLVVMSMFALIPAAVFGQAWASKRSK